MLSPPAADDVLTEGRQIPLARTAAAGLAAVCSLQFAAMRPIVFMPLLLLGLMLLCLVGLVSRRNPSVGAAVVVALVMGVAALGVVANASLAVALDAPAGMSVGLAMVMLASAAIAVWGPCSWRRWALGVLLVAYAALAASRIVHAEVVIDVGAFLRGGIDALMHGTSPYAITIDNPYGPAETRLFYGPGVVVGGVVQAGFPYLPAPLLVDVPAFLLGDPRWMHLAALLAATGLAWRLASDVLGRATAVLMVCGATSSTVVISYWVEPVMSLLLVLTVLGLTTGRRWTATALGVLFASKQYAISYLPTLVTVARTSGWRTVLVAGAVGAAVLVPFVVWDVQAFVHSAIEFQLVQPFRDDAITLLPSLQAWFGELPGWMLSLSPLLGMATSALVVWRTRPGPTAFALGIGLSLLVTVLTSKIGFMNYYAFIGVAFVLATVTWPVDDPMPGAARAVDQTREPSSHGSRPRGISRTR